MTSRINYLIDLNGLLKCRCDGSQAFCLFSMIPVDYGYFIERVWVNHRILQKLYRMSLNTGGDNLGIHSDAVVHEQSALSKMFGRLDGITVVWFIEWS